MASEDPFEGILAKLTTEEGKEEFIRDELERRERVEVISVERTSTGWRVVTKRFPGRRNESIAREKLIADTEVDDEFLDRIKQPIRNLAMNKPGVFAQILRYRKLPNLAAAESLVEQKGELLTAIRCGSAEPDVRKFDILMGGMMASYILVDRLSDLCAHIGGAGIPVISGFRTLGLDVKEGLGDPDGIYDASDDYGHWSGNAVDLRTRDWRLALGYRNLDDNGNIVADSKYTSFNELDYIADEFGLFRPFKHPDSDAPHWTIVEQTKWYITPDHSKRYTRGWANSKWDRKCPRMR
jgi:hypothetical protein